MEVTSSNPKRDLVRALYYKPWYRLLVAIPYSIIFLLDPIGTLHPIISGLYGFVALYAIGTVPAFLIAFVGYLAERFPKAFQVTAETGVVVGSYLMGGFLVALVGAAVVFVGGAVLGFLKMGWNAL